MKRSKSLYSVYITYYRRLLPWAVQLYVHAYSPCDALNRVIAHLHESLGIPLDCIDHKSAEVIHLPNFIK